MESHNAISYKDEISKMLFGFGDHPTPNKDTVGLVETIVLQQLRGIIQEALKYSNESTLNGKELIFLMRRNKHKMHRFIRYLQNKELKKEIQKDTVDPNLLNVDLPKHPLIDFIEYIDQTGELMDLTELDAVKYARQVRADSISQILNQKKYTEYQKARTVSFHKENDANLNTFRHWIDPKGEVKFEDTALDVLAYYAFETVAQLVDFAFEVRLDSKKGPDSLTAYTKVCCVQQPFTVDEIKEVMRRVTTPQTGRLYFGGKMPEKHPFIAL